MDRIADAIEKAIGGEAGNSELASAKINLALHVTGRRTDGYHLLESLVVFADFGDIVAVFPSPGGKMGLTVKGPFADALAETTRRRDNLAARAADDLLGAAGKRARPVRLVLTKRIPIAAGLGGGSADAAATLRLLDRHWGLNLGAARLAEIGARLGADVPMCLASVPLIASGIGDRLAPVRGIPALPIVLAHPGVAVPTGEVFARLGNTERPPLAPLPRKLGSALDLLFWLRQTRNDLSEPASAVAKAAGAAARALTRDPDCLFARMSGSGAAAFGIFATLAAAERAAARLSAAKPNWWVTAAMTRAS